MEIREQRLRYRGNRVIIILESLTRCIRTDRAEEPGSCNYESSFDVSEPAALITGLEFNTQYYFAVSASSEDGRRSLCSNEASQLTPDAPQIQIGDPPVRLDSASPQCDAERGKSNNANTERECTHREG